MKTILEAKKDFTVRYLSEEGFVGGGIGRCEDSDALQVYVEGPDFPLLFEKPNIQETFLILQILILTVLLPKIFTYL